MTKTIIHNNLNSCFLPNEEYNLQIGFSWIIKAAFGNIGVDDLIVF